MTIKERADFVLQCQRFIQAMAEAGKFAANVERLRADFQGTSFDYFHHDDIKDAEQAAERAGTILADFNSPHDNPGRRHKKGTGSVTQALSLTVYVTKGEGM